MEQAFGFIQFWGQELPFEGGPVIRKYLITMGYPCSLCVPTLSLPAPHLPTPFNDFTGQFCKPQIDANIPQLLVVSSVLNSGSACILTPWICPCFNVVKCFKHIANWNIAWSSMPSYQLLFFNFRKLLVYIQNVIVFIF